MLQCAPMPKPSGIFDPGFLVALEVSVKIHHIIYARLPPQGIYFEALVEESFRKIKKPFTVIERGGRTAPGHDLKVENRCMLEQWDIKVPED